MKAIKIDAKNRQVIEVDITSDYNDINKQIGCQIFTIAHSLKKRDTIMVDDEGLYNNENIFFAYNGAWQPFAGNGLIVGCNTKGDTIDCKIDINEVKQNVKFYDRYELAMAMAFGKVKFQYMVRLLELLLITGFGIALWGVDSIITKFENKKKNK